jgi:hypothetical protein
MEVDYWASEKGHFCLWPYILNTDGEHEFTDEEDRSAGRI